MLKAATTFLTLLGLIASTLAGVEIELDLTNQRAYLIQDGDIVYDSPISSGRSSHPTPVGQFKVTQKSIDHRSSLYGRVVDARGRVVTADADSSTPVPPDGKFERAPMRYFLRFNGAVGMHAGILPGYPASHGCVRLPASKAALFYNVAEIGTPVRVYGRAPYRAASTVARSTTADSRRPAPRGVKRIPFFYRLF
jgi:lipoprotein-anchoring transpeptidase ErfK/SrfK